MRADFQHYYHLDLMELLDGQCRRAASLAAYLPFGAAIWVEAHDARAWTSQEYLTAALLDEIRLHYWSIADHKHRGKKPKLIPRPTDKPRKRQKQNDAVAVNIDEVEEVLKRIRSGIQSI